MLVCGGEDPGAAVQAGEAFNALRRLGQCVELLRYEGEGHWPGTWSDPNVRDLAARVLAWYAKHLQGNGEPDVIR